MHRAHPRRAQRARYIRMNTLVYILPKRALAGGMRPRAALLATWLCTTALADGSRPPHALDCLFGVNVHMCVGSLELCPGWVFLRFLAVILTQSSTRCSLHLINESPAWSEVQVHRALREPLRPTAGSPKHRGHVDLRPRPRVGATWDHPGRQRGLYRPPDPAVSTEHVVLA
jgi:hypothetical protein